MALEYTVETKDITQSLVMFSGVTTPECVIQLSCE